MKRLKDKFSHPSEIPQYTAHQFPYKFKESMLEDCHRLARFGCTSEEIAGFLKINLQTFNAYNRDIPEFRDALEQGRMWDSMKVVDSLHKQALGYVVEEVEVAEHMDRNGLIRKLTKKTTKHILPK